MITIYDKRGTPIQLSRGANERYQLLYRTAIKDKWTLHKVLQMTGKMGITGTLVIHLFERVKETQLKEPQIAVPVSLKICDYRNETYEASRQKLIRKMFFARIDAETTKPVHRKKVVDTERIARRNAGKLALDTADLSID